MIDSALGLASWYAWHFSVGVKVGNYIIKSSLSPLFSVPIILQNIAIRVNGIDTPEIRGKCKKEKELAINARDFVRNLLLKAKVIKLTNIARGKYFRIVANVLIDGDSLEKQVLNKKLAYVYDGGKKLGWCN